MTTKVGNPFHAKEDGRFTISPFPGTDAWHERVASIIPNTGDTIGVPAGFNVAPPPQGVRPAVHLGDSNIESLLEYRGDSFININNYLRTGTATVGLREMDNHIADRLVDEIDAAFRHSAPTSEEITLYRGVKTGVWDNIKAFGELADNGLPKNFRDRAYVSTTYDKKSADTYATQNGGAVMKIVVPKGTHVIPMSDQDDGEGEILFPRGTSFHIQSDGSYKAVVPSRVPVRIAAKAPKTREERMVEHAKIAKLLESSPKNQGKSHLTAAAVQKFFNRHKIKSVIAAAEEFFRKQG